MRVKTKDLAAEGTNIQFVLFSCSPSSDLSEKTIKAFIANWHHCDTTPNLEIASRTVGATKAFGVEKYIASPLCGLGRTYYYNSRFDFFAYANLEQAYRLFNALSPDNFTQ